MPRAVYRQKGGLRALSRGTKKKVPQRKSSTTPTLKPKTKPKTKSKTKPTPTPKSKPIKTKTNTKQTRKANETVVKSVPRPIAARSQHARAVESPTVTGVKVVWSNNRVRRGRATAASSSVPHPFAAFDAEEVDLSIPSFQTHPPSVENEPQQDQEQDQEETVGPEEESISVEKDPESVEVEGKKSEEQVESPSETQNHGQGSTSIEVSREKLAEGESVDEVKSWKAKAQSILDAYTDKGHSVVSPLSSWYFLGGAPDFRPAASRRRKRKRTVPMFPDPVEDEKQVKRVKSENKQVLETFEKELQEARKEEQAFTKSLLEKLGSKQAVPTS